MKPGGNPEELSFLLLLIKIKKETWLDRTYVTIDGKFQKEDEKAEGTRMLMLGRITFELIRFKKHNDQVEWWKEVWPLMKKKLQSDHIIIRWDFIGIFKNTTLSFSFCSSNNRELCP